MSARVCPCVWCQVDNDKGRPLRLARWRDGGTYWAPYRTDHREWPGVDRERASLFGPQHTAEIRRNPLFVIVKPRASAVASARGAR